MKKLILSALIIIVGSNLSLAQKVNTNADNVVINGYDVVNYFTTNSAARGSVEFSQAYKGATYYFVNAENKKMFNANPNAYLPQYDGYCAFAVAKMNKKVPIDPHTFRIDDGKLYLFFNDFFEGSPFNTIVPWINNEAAMEQLAEQNWKTLKGK